jgi:hypothetical protein
LRAGGHDRVRALYDALVALAAHLRAFGEPRLAARVDEAREGERNGMPQRALELFQHGMGGLLDVPLYRDPQGNLALSERPSVDQQATARRDGLAEDVYEAAKALLR